MASASIVPASITIPNGGSVDVEVIWSLDPGTPDQNGFLRLELDGAVLFDAPIVKQGVPAESEPQIVLAAPQAGQALLSSDIASIAQLSARTFRLS